VANANDTASTVNDYTLTLVNAKVAADSIFTVNASALRAGVITGLGADNEIGGGDDITSHENLNLDAHALTGTRSLVVQGGASLDTVLGGAGADTIFGGGGNDSLVGNGGHDIIDGGAGNDRITDGAGSDIVSGGE
jgi:Ca2+-binding RTX toxin-like protein